MSTTVTIIIVVVAAAIICAGLALAARQRAERRKLRERFGPEYERAIDTSGDTRTAEADLRARAELRDRLAIRPLTAQQRGAYEREWREIQAEFVDAPARSLGRADALLTSVMVDRGYPMQDFEAQADLISVDHPQVVEHYRTGHRIQTSSEAGRATTEDIREAFVSYRELFAQLVDDEAPDAGTPQGAPRAA